MKPREISLRDYFAAMAMQGFVANPDGGGVLNPDKVAKWSVDQANALIRALAMNWKAGD